MHTLSFQALSDVASPLAGVLVASVWTAALVAGLVWAVLRGLPRLSAAARSVLWSAVLLATLLLSVMPLWMQRHTGVLPFQRADAAGSAIVVAPGWAVLLVAVWAVLSAWRLAALAWSGWRLHRLVGAATPARTSGLVAAALRSAGRRAELCVSAEVRRPSVAGFFRPRILLPAGLIQSLTETELEQIVLHELEHLQRRDDWTNLLQKLALAVFPLNPVLFWLDRRLAAERELACDDAVMQRTGARRSYAACLVTLAERDSLLGRGVSLALGAWDRQSELMRRVRRIVAEPARAMHPAASKLAVGAIAGGLLLSSDALLHAPEMVRFATAPTAPLTVASSEAPGRLAAARPVMTLAKAPARREAGPLIARAPHAVDAVAVMPSRPAAVAEASAPVPSAPRAQAAPHAVLASATASGRVARRSAAGRSRDLVAAEDMSPGQAVLAMEQLSDADWNALAGMLRMAELSAMQQQAIAQAAVLRREPVRTTHAAPASRNLDLQPSYAAVRVPDGWLIVQL